MDWLSALLGLSGTALCGSGYRIGWILYAMASGINSFLGFHSGLFGMGFGCILYLILELRGWYKARKIIKIYEELN